MNLYWQKKLLNLYALFFLERGYRVMKKALKDPSFWLEAQNKAIPNFAKYIYTIPFYRKRFEDAGITAQAIRTGEDFKKLPPLTKEEYRAYLTEGTKDKNKFKDWMNRQTTGSSGSPLDLYSLPTDRAAEIANLFRCALIQDCGYNPLFDRIFSTMVPKPSAPPKKFALPYIAKMSSISEPKDLVEGYNLAKPDFYYGNKTAILMIATYALENGIPLHVPKCLGSISEPLYESDRKTINAAFGEGKLFDIYGCAETGNFAVDKPSQPNCHFIWHDTHVVNLTNEETNPENSNVSTGQLMLTSLIHKGFPLVNYIVGDTLELTKKNGVPFITKILGRTNDVIKNLDGSSFKWMHINRVMFGLTDIAQFRVIQKSYTDLIFVLAAPKFSAERKKEVESQIKNRALEYFGSDLKTTGKNIKIEWTDRIPPDPTGKIRILVSEIKE